MKTPRNPYARQNQNSGKTVGRGLTAHGQPATQRKTVSNPFARANRSAKFVR